MKIDELTVDRIAHLARLEVSQAEKAELMQDMGKILDFMAKLNEIDTSGIEPLVYMSPVVNGTRPDLNMQTINTANALKNAPKHDDLYFKVAKVIPD